MTVKRCFVHCVTIGDEFDVLWRLLQHADVADLCVIVKCRQPVLKSHTPYSNFLLEIQISFTCYPSTLLKFGVLWLVKNQS